MDVLMMTPGPTFVNEKVRAALSRPITNPDLDYTFYEFYKETCCSVQRLFRTKNDILLLSGEGILGLEAACASLVEPGDKVLCIDNGIFGHGFGDFLNMYDGKVTYFKSDYQEAIDVNALRQFLKENNDFKLATIVHCETPSGITNPVEDICKLLKSYGILTVVDAVSSIAGEEVLVDDWSIDMVLGASQKCLSAPPGITFLSVSEAAWHKILNRTKPIRGYYCNLAVWKTWYQDKWFPYTQAISDLYAFSEAVDQALQNDYITRHKRLGHAVRQTMIHAGFSLYASSGYSNTVTTVEMPAGISFNDLYGIMLDEHQVMIAGAFDYLKDKVFRIGHMGENCYEEKLYKTFKALDHSFRTLGLNLPVELHKTFISYI